MVYKFFERLYDKKVCPLGLSLFRIAIGLVLFIEVFQLLKYRHLIFDVTPYLEFSAILDYKYALLIWLMVIVFLIMGLFTRVAVVINYAYSVLFFATISNFGDHMLVVFMSINFLLLFVRVSATWSIDAVIYKIKSGKIHYHPKVSVLNYYSLVFITLALVYFISLFDKYFTEFWRNGMIFHIAQSLPEYSNFNIQPLLNQKWIMMIFTYATLAFETLFIIVWFRRKWRPVVSGFGLILHFSIFLFFPFTVLPLGFMALYILLVPFSFWEYLKTRFVSKSTTVILLNGNHPIAASLDTIIKAFDIFKHFDTRLVKFNHKKPSDEDSMNTPIFLGFESNIRVTKFYHKVAYIMIRMPITAIFGLVLFVPIINRLALKVYKHLLITTIVIIQNLPEVKMSKSDSNFRLKRMKVNLVIFGGFILALFQANAFLKTNFAKIMNLPSANVRMYQTGKALFGIDRHGMFRDDFKQGALYTIGITKINFKSTETWLPLMQGDTRLGRYKKNTLLKRSYFRTSKSHVDSLRLYKYVKDFTAFWSFEQSIDLDNASFNVYIKKYDVPQQFEHNIYQRNIDRPWIHLGKVIWRDTLFYSQLDLTKVNFIDN